MKYLNSKETNYSIVLGNANHSLEKEAAHPQDMINRNVDGLIIEPTRSALPSSNIKYFHKLREKGIPFVMIDSYFDDSDLAILSEVPLTTVAHPKGKMGEKAGKMLLQLIESSSTSQVQQFVYKPQLIIRDSCKSMC
ncbi:hypothetical protein CEE34_07955 [Candidatus Aerophobetes bacterium Ae_b3a]|nr:MAG: hypothetical protein CEE34_07955 [Candidatus Aerophobetes bacterium Ae_b3a]